MLGADRTGDLERAWIISVSAPVFVWNLPTVLTLARLASVPVLAALLAWNGGTSDVARDIAAAVFVLASVTDFADGALARKRGQITPFGTLMDPIADKALIAVALIGLSALNEIPWWITVVILTREIVVTVLRLRLVKDRVIPATAGAKAKTLTQIVAITMYLLAWTNIPGWTFVSALTLGIAVILTVVTGLDYVWRILRAPNKDRR